MFNNPIKVNVNKCAATSGALVYVSPLIDCTCVTGHALQRTSTDQIITFSNSDQWPEVVSRAGEGFLTGPLDQNVLGP